MTHQPIDPTRWCHEQGHHDWLMHCTHNHDRLCCMHAEASRPPVSGDALPSGLLHLEAREAVTRALEWFGGLASRQGHSEHDAEAFMDALAQQGFIVAARLSSGGEDHPE